MSSSSSLPETEQQEQELILQLMSMLMISAFASSGSPDGGRIRLIIPATPSTEFENLYGKDGVLPASKAAIAAMPAVKIAAGEEEGECSICLTEYGAGDEVKEMPCKHRYHSGCVEKWLGIHGSCPVCRYEMPVDKETERVGQAALVIIDFVFPPGLGGESDMGGAPDRSGSGDDSEGPR